jgi:tetratricopeptide (TPR) repeat protein
MKKRLLIFFLCVSLGGMATQGQNLEKGIWYMKQRQYISAKNIFAALLQKNPNSGKHLFYMGQVCYALGQADSAEAFYQKGILLDPKEPLNYLGAGRTILNNNNRPEWFKMYDKGRRLANNLFDYNLEAADACLSSTVKNYDLVEKYLDEAQTDEDKNPDLFIGYGNLYMVSKSPGDAVNSYQRAIFYDKNNVEAYVKLGEIYSKANNFNDGRTAFNKAIELDSSQIIGYKLRGDMFYNFAKYQEAKKDYDIYIPRSDQTIEDRQKYVYILYFAKDYDHAMALAEELLKIDPNLTILYRIKAYIDYDTEKYPEGLANLQTFFVQHDTTKFIAQDFVYYGRLLIKNNQDSLGCIELQKALVMDSTKTELYDDLAKSYTKQKDFLQAIDAYKKLLVLDPNNHQNIYYQMGRSYYFLAEDTLSGLDSLQKIEMYNQADSSFRKVTELNPESYIGFIWLARTHSRLDPETSLGLAKPDYEAAMALLEKGDPTKTPKLLLECYRYLAFYYYLQSDKLAKTDPAQSKLDMTNSINYWEKVLTIEPTDAQAKTALENLKAQ